MASSINDPDDEDLSGDLDLQGQLAGFRISTKPIEHYGFLLRGDFEPGVADKMVAVLSQRREYLRSQLEECSMEKIERLQGQISEIKAQLERLQAKGYDSQRAMARVEATRRTPEY